MIAPRIFLSLRVPDRRENPNFGQAQRLETAR